MEEPPTVAFFTFETIVQRELFFRTFTSWSYRLESLFSRE